MSNRKSVFSLPDKATIRLQDLLQNPRLHHCCFWVLSSYILFRIFNQDPEYFITDLIYTVLFEMGLLVVVYLQLWVLIPRFLQPGRYLFYLLGFAFSLWLGMAAHWLTFAYLAGRLFPGYYFISYYQLSELIQFMLVFAAAATLLKLSKSWFELRNKEKQIHRLEREKLDAELQALKAQLDPHFLFNSLNNVYSLMLDEDKMAPTYLLHLSNNLRYMLYECKDPLVPLEKELEYLQNYLALQRLKIDAGAIVELEVRGKIDGQKVAPLLFIPFVENSFKHGMKGKVREAVIKISFAIGPETLYFHIRNTCPAITGDDMSSLPGTGGIGLENVRKRLKLLYPQRHRLHIDHTERYFDVTLELLSSPTLQAPC